MADRSVVAREESHKSEASARKVLLYRRSGLLYFAVPKSFCVSMPREGIEIFHRSPRKLRENSGDEGKEFSWPRN